MTLEHALIAAVSALAIVVGRLWVTIENELRECTEDRKSLRVLIMKNTVGHNE